VFAKSAVAPLDRVKILFQTLSKAYPRNSPLHTLKHIYKVCVVFVRQSRNIDDVFVICAMYLFLTFLLKVEGIRGLWKGNWSSVVRIYPYAAIQFASFERYKRVLRSMSNSGTMFFGGHFLAGSMAGATAVCFTYPLDVVRARLAFQFASKGL
jgi:solute carrier family 25 protein 16